MTRDDRRRILDALTAALDALNEADPDNELSPVRETINDALERYLTRWPDLVDST